MSNRIFSITAQVLLTVYLQVFMWLPLGYWNGKFAWITADYFKDFAGYLLWALLGVFSLMGFVARKRGLMVFGLLFHLTWLVMHVFDWWVPYVQGASPERLAWYQRDFGNTWFWLPRSGNHWPPNAGHVVIDILLVAVLVSGTRYTASVWKMKRKQKSQH